MGSSVSSLLKTSPASGSRNNLDPPADAPMKPPLTMEPPEPWFTTSPTWTSASGELLSTSNNTDPIADVSLDEIIEKSSTFPRKFPIESVRCHQLVQNKVPKHVLEKNINSVYPVIHEHALYLCSVFLNHQKQFGNREFYRNVSLLDLIDRFLSKRAVSFLGPHDYYMLIDGATGTGGWENVGTQNEAPPLTLDNCLSYDEMKLSAFLSISSHTYFINDGNRSNFGVPEGNRTKIEDDGVIIGLIGTRLHKQKVMEYRDIMKTPTQNNRENGYGKSTPPTLQGEFLKFYGDVNATYADLLPQMKSQSRYVNLKGDRYFDKLVYSRRITLSIDTLLIEANDRAKKLNKMAYVHVVGLGLGVWRIYHEGQDQIFMDTFAERLEFLSDVLKNISDVRFAYIAHKMAGPYKHGDELKGIKLHMVDQKGPHEKLTGTDEGKLLVVSYAWDSNSLPGNEFWFENLHTSSDPAAACSTQVAELHNWRVNRKASARNLRVATLKGLVTFQEYQDMHRDQ